MSLTAGAVALVLLGTAAGQQATPPATPAVRFAVKGVWGDATPAQAAVPRRMCAEDRRAPFAFVATTGDNFSVPLGTATEANFTRPERCLVARGLTWYAAWGNHDVHAAGTAEALGSPRRYRAVVRGPVLLLILDGNDPDDPAQLRFIRRRLAAATQPVRIVAFHQPIRTAGPHPPAEAARRLWEPLFRRAGVALVLQGHNHLYERLEVDGITYVTTGGGGAQVYPCIRPAEGLRRCAFRHHFLVVDASAGGAAVRAVTPGGATIERVLVPARA
jgi:acid phosphatase